MDAHKVLDKVFQYYHIYDIPKIYIYSSLSAIGVFYLILYIFSTVSYKKEDDLITVNALKKKIKELQALNDELCEANIQFRETLNNVEQKLEVFSKQTTFRLDMQSAEQQQIRSIVNKTITEIDKFYVAEDE